MRSGGKPDVQVIAEIFKEYGPLHVTDLVVIGQSRGVTFKGSKKPTLMARDKMYGSKRFHNFGNNVWGLPHQELLASKKKIEDSATSQQFLKDLVLLCEKYGFKVSGGYADDKLMQVTFRPEGP